MKTEVSTRPANRRFRAAIGTGEHWGAAAKACLNGLNAAALSANIGFIYVTETLGDHLPSILTFLRETTRISHWTGAVVPGICFGDQEHRRDGAIAAMVGHLPDDAFLCFSGLDVPRIRELTGNWLGGGRPSLGIVHADPRNAAVVQVVEELARDTVALVGALVSSLGSPSQVADTVVSGGLSGLLLGPNIQVVTAMSQGCTPIGLNHKVTEAWHGVLMGLDGRPALEVLKEEAGELIARDLKRAAGYIHVALDASADDNHDYLVRSLVGIDPRHGWLALGERLALGQELMFVRRDANAARRDLRRMLVQVESQIGSRPIRAALYVSCIGRGEHMFGEPGAELELVRDALGDDVPLIGLFANGEIAGGRLYGYTGVLAVILGDRS